MRVDFVIVIYDHDIAVYMYVYIYGFFNTSIITDIFITLIKVRMDNPSETSG